MTNITVVTRKAKTLVNLQLSAVDFEELISAGEPVILKGAFLHSPLCQAGLQSSEEAMSYLLSKYNQKPVLRFLAEPEIKGRFSYNEAMNGFNYKADRIDLGEVFRQILAEESEAPSKAHYVGSTSIKNFFVDLESAAELNFGGAIFRDYQPKMSIWMGNETTTAAHYDMSNNIAACLVGKRRFTLFPPDQIANLYPGPLEPTPGGQVISLVNFDEPDLKRFPNFPKAVESGQVAELEAGDVLVYPAMWWHQVEALAPFNVLVNYWWNSVPAYLDDPQNTLLHAMLSIRDRPEHEKQAWRDVMDYYIFGDSSTVTQNMPEQIQGPLARLNDQKARQLRSKLIQKLNR